MVWKAVVVKFDFAVEQAIFRERPNRFLVIAELVASDEVVRVHCPDPGRLAELLLPEAILYISPAAGPKRKTSYVLRFVVHPDPVAQGQLVSLDTRLPNNLVAEGLANGWFPALAGYTAIAREVSVPRAIAGDGVRSRIDYRLTGGGTQAPCWVEVKSVTLVEDRRALFPDAVTARGRRHVLELAHLHTHTHTQERAVILFVIQRPDVDVFSPQAARDPDFAAALRQAHNQGVEILAYRCRLTLTEIVLDASVPIEL
ncbi:MAG: DNA/RNA nuclease SfsA [Litorilinea sp.]